jgi:biopolymer transport protein ExbD
MLCLLIFFMIVSRQGMDAGADQRLEIPTTIQGIRIEDLGNTATLNLYATDSGTEVTTLNEATGQQIPMPLSQSGREPLREFLIAGKARNERFKVILRADKEMTYRYLEPVLRVCAEAGVESVNFATKREGT